MRRHLALTALVASAVASIATSRNISYSVEDTTSLEVTLQPEATRSWRVTLTSTPDTIVEGIEDVDIWLAIGGSVEIDPGGEVDIDLTTVSQGNQVSGDTQVVRLTDGGQETIDLLTQIRVDCQPQVVCTHTWDLMLSHVAGEGALTGTLDIHATLFADGPETAPQSPAITLEVTPIDAE